jgi:hypothetical protein
MIETIQQANGAFDPRRDIEGRFGPNKPKLISKLDKSLKGDESYIDQQSDDPLAIIWGAAPLYYWSPSAKSYQLVAGTTVGGTD